MINILFIFCYLFKLLEFILLQLFRLFIKEYLYKLYQMFLSQLIILSYMLFFNRYANFK